MPVVPWVRGFFPRGGGGKQQGRGVSATAKKKCIHTSAPPSPSLVKHRDNFTSTLMFKSLKSCYMFRLTWASQILFGKSGGGRSYFTTDGQSVSMFWYRAPLWDLRPDATSCRNVAVWNLRSCFCGAPSLTRGRVCNLRCNHSMVRVAQNPIPYFTVSPETPPTWRARFPYLYPAWTGWAGYTPGHWVWQKCLMYLWS
jgi:hypothetical protein